MSRAPHDTGAEGRSGRNLAVPGARKPGRVVLRGDSAVARVVPEAGVDLRRATRETHPALLVSPLIWRKEIEPDTVILSKRGSVSCVNQPAHQRRLINSISPSGRAFPERVTPVLCCQFSSRATSGRPW